MLSHEYDHLFGILHIDIAEKTIDLATLQAIYQASLQVSASIIQKSLVDYI